MPHDWLTAWLDIYMNKLGSWSGQLVCMYMKSKSLTLVQTSSVESKMFPKNGFTAALETSMSIPPHCSTVCKGNKICTTSPTIRKVVLFREKHKERSPCWSAFLCPPYFPHYKLYRSLGCFHCVTATQPCPRWPVDGCWQQRELRSSPTPVQLPSQCWKFRQCTVIHNCGLIVCLQLV